MPSEKGFGNARNKGPKHGVTYDLRPGRAARKAKRQAKRDAIKAMPGATGLERRLNYKAAKDRARRADKAAVKKASSITPEQRKTSQTKATSDHSKRLSEAISKYGGKKNEVKSNKPKLSKTRVAFNKAFAAASKAGKETFMFNNKKYTTKKA